MSKKGGYYTTQRPPCYRRYSGMRWWIYPNGVRLDILGWRVPYRVHIDGNYRRTESNEILTLHMS